MNKNSPRNKKIPKLRTKSSSGKKSDHKNKNTAEQEENKTRSRYIPLNEVLLSTYYNTTNTDNENFSTLSKEEEEIVVLPKIIYDKIPKFNSSNTVVTFKKMYKFNTLNPLPYSQKPKVNVTSSKNKQILLNKSEKKKISDIFRTGISQKDLLNTFLNTPKTKIGSHNDNHLEYESFLNQLDKETERKNTQPNTQPNKSPAYAYHPEIHFKSIEEFSKNNVASHIAHLNNQIDTKFSYTTKLIDPKNISRNYKYDQKAININEVIVKTNIKNKKSITGTLREEVNYQIKKQTLELKQEKRIEIRRKWRRQIMEVALRFKRLNIDLDQFYSQLYIPSKPYEKPESVELISAVKAGDIKNVFRLLRKNSENKLLVHNFDYFNQTPLHWAAKRNEYYMISILVRYGARVDAADLSGRTALHLAVERNCLDSVKILLFELASPFKRNNEGKLPIDLTEDRVIRFYLERAKNLHIINQFDNALTSFKRIRQGFKFFFDFSDNYVLNGLIMEKNFENVIDNYVLESES